MNFEWNDAKSLACFDERGFDFAYAAAAFSDPHRLIEQDRRFSYGEDRYQSARKANSREVQRYENRPHAH